MSDLTKKGCEVIIEQEYDKPFKGTIQLNSNFKTNLNAPNSNFFVNIMNGISPGAKDGTGLLVMDSITFMNDIPNINSLNYGFTLNGTPGTFTIGQYNTEVQLLNQISSVLTTAAGHLISVVLTPTMQIEFTGTVGFTDTIVFSPFLIKMIGLQSTMLILNGVTPVFSNFFIIDPPIYSRWCNVNVFGMYTDQSYSYNANNWSMMSCVPLSTYGQQILHREVEYRPLQARNYVSGIQITILDEFGNYLPIGNNSVVINIFYK